MQKNSLRRIICLSWFGGFVFSPYSVVLKANISRPLFISHVYQNWNFWHILVCYLDTLFLLSDLEHSHRYHSRNWSQKNVWQCEERQGGSKNVNFLTDVIYERSPKTEIVENFNCKLITKEDIKSYCTIIRTSGGEDLA
jgi:hypothetical protein